MTQFAALLEDLQASILSGDTTRALPAIKANPRISAHEQMRIYIEGYRIHLSAAVASDYPALITHIGQDAFNEVARDYIEQTPSSFYNLDVYPHGFAVFFAQRSTDLFAAELARVEASIATVFMAADSKPLEASHLHDLSPETFSTTILLPRTACVLLSLHHPVNSWLEAQRNGLALPAPAPEESFLLIYRHEHQVKRTTLNRPQYHLLHPLAKGLPVSEALELVWENHPELAQTMLAELHQWFSQWVQDGVFKHP